MESKRLFFGISLLLLFLAAAAAVAFFRTGGEKNTEFSPENMPGEGIQFTVSEGMVLANGVTNMGITEEVFEVENLTAELEIEEIYIHSEDVVEKGDKVLKLSETGIARAREELEQTLREAELACRAGKIEYEQSKITLQYDRDSKVLDGGQAKAVYEETLSGLQDAVEEAEKELEETKEKIAEYQSYVSDSSYRSYFKVDEYQTAYEETLEVLKDKMDDWGVSWQQVTGGENSVNTGGAGTSAEESVSAGGVSGNDVSGNDTPQKAGPGRDQIQVLSSLYKVLESLGKKLEQAESECEDATVNAAFELQTLELGLPELEQKLTEAEKNYQAEVLQAEVTYEKALANAENAQSDYEAAMRKAETAYEKLESDWEDAKENLALFEESVGDGCFYASGRGTVLRMMVREGEELSAEGVVFAYSNPAEMTVTVSVNQTDIADISLEDKVYIQTEEHGGFEGIVTKIDPIAASDSRTNVTYSVVVEFENKTEAVSANESVIAVFGMEEEAIREAVSAAGEAQQNTEPRGEEIPENGQIPEGGGMPGSRETPESVRMPGSEEMSENEQLLEGKQESERKQAQEDSGAGRKP